MAAWGLNEIRIRLNMAATHTKCLNEVSYHYHDTGLLDFSPLLAARSWRGRGLCLPCLKSKITTTTNHVFPKVFLRNQNSFNNKGTHKTNTPQLFQLPHRVMLLWASPTHTWVTTFWFEKTSFLPSHELQHFWCHFHKKTSGLCQSQVSELFLQLGIS